MTRPNENLAQDVLNNSLAEYERRKAARSPSREEALRILEAEIKQCREWVKREKVKSRELMAEILNQR